MATADVSWLEAAPGASAQVSWLQAAPGGYVLTADVGAFTLAGQDAALTLGGAAQTAQVSWLQAGPPPSAYTLTAEPGAFTFSFAGSLSDVVVTAAGGSFALTGRDAALSYGQVLQAYTLTAELGAYTLAGQAATLRYVVPPPAVLGGPRVLVSNLAASGRSNAAGARRPAQLARM